MKTTHLSIHRITGTIKERLLQLPQVANVEVFGAHQPVVRVTLNRDKLQRFGLTPADVSRRLVASNANQPFGLLLTSESQYLFKRTGEFQSTSDVARIFQHGDRQSSRV
jgi:multidrug efflux pump subunit AcrB